MAKKNEIKLKDFSKESVENNKLYKNLTGEVITIDTSICEVAGDVKQIEPILEIRRGAEENIVEITTFGYVGRFTYKGVEFDITYRFGDLLLDRMIAKVNDFDIKSLPFDAESKKGQSDSLAMKILYINFILKLEKLSILGIPKSYKRIEHHDSKLKGQIDINRFIKKDIPFQGKISSVSYEHCYVQEILDVLYGALIVVEKSMKKAVDDRLFQIKNLIYNHANRRFVDERTIENAMHHKSIQNSLYGNFKQLLKISSYIIRYHNEQKKKANSQFIGLVFDVSLLWEGYLYKLLKESLEDENWRVIHEERVSVYQGKFYERNMYPDILIKNDTEKKAIVFDAKSKSMTMQGKDQYGAGDVDRTDFFQIHTYISYYISYYMNSGYEVVAGGLLYPFKSKVDKKQCHSENLFGNDSGGTKFIIDGIEILNDKIVKRIKILEKIFINRIKDVMGS
jgi:5-methylcytosine-specific restriction endonuclease McrBC regulatory subunit McrC